ncbi:hypothetical protein SUGI_0463670 [Cryptomeria japonica]|nr:hypothetical protein SUGI_0463670 [Cryptomeria japonica]
MVSMISNSMNGESHKALKGLFRFPHINIDSSDGVLKECFLDLGLFPEDRKICADALLDIWVYVRKLQRHDAFAILSELASRNLLKLLR